MGPNSTIAGVWPSGGVVDQDLASRLEQRPARQACLNPQPVHVASGAASVCNHDDMLEAREVQASSSPPRSRHTRAIEEESHERG
jgi:hypothetical protein